MATGSDLRTARVGSVNRDRQIILRVVDAAGDEPDRRVYVLACLNPECRHQYGAIASDITRRHCPSCQGGSPDCPLPRRGRRKTFWPRSMPCPTRTIGRRPARGMMPSSMGRAVETSGDVDGLRGYGGLVRPL